MKADAPADGSGAAASVSPTQPTRAARTDRRVLINTSALAGSSLWRIGLSFVLQIWIANRLGVEGLGGYTAALAYLNVCQILSELGLPQLLVRDLARQPGRRRAAFHTALTMQIGAALLVWLGLALLVWLLPFTATTQRAVLVIAASLPFFAVTSACQTLFQAGERMELVMGVEVIINSVIAAGSVAVLWAGGGVVQLAAVIIGSQALSALLCLLLLRRSALLKTEGATAQEEAPQGPWPMAQELWRHSRPFHGLALAGVLLHRMDILLLSVVAGEAITGIYAAAYLVVRIFVILSQTYWQALYPTLSRLRAESTPHYRRLVELGVRFGLIGLLPIAAVGMGLAEPLLSLIFREDLYGASVAAFRLLIWVAPLFFIASYGINLLLVERRPQRSLAVALLHIGAVASLLPPLAAAQQARGAAGAMLIATAISGATALFLVRSVRFKMVLPRWPVLLGATLLAGAVVPLILRLLPVTPLSWLGAGLAGAALYAAVIWWGRVLSVEDLRLFQKAVQH